MRYAYFLHFFIISVSLLGVLCFTDDVLANNENTPVDGMDFAKLEGRIVNGTKAELGQFPHQVSLRRSYSNSQHFCGGSVIAPNWILTAAHCVVNKHGVKIQAATVTAVAGQIVLRPFFDHTQKRAAGSIIVHDYYDHSTLTNDIALIWVKTPFIFNTSWIQPGKLSTKMPAPGNRCEVSGWGYKVENSTVSNDLMFVSLPLISRDRCRQLLEGVTYMTLGKFCAGYDEGGRDACQGDSGGGVMCGNQLTGIVSGGLGCARPKLPGFYTDVPFYNNWIKYQMKMFNSTVSNGTEWKPSKPTRRPNSSSNVHSSFSLCPIITAYAMLNYFGISLSDWA